MAYHVECHLCFHRIEVADGAAAPGPQCPECGSFHTLMPVTVRPKASVATLLRDSDPSLLMPPPAPPALVAPPPAPPRPAPILPRPVEVGVRPASPPPRPAPAAAERPTTPRPAATPVPRGILVSPPAPPRRQPPVELPRAAEPEDATLGTGEGVATVPDHAPVRKSSAKTPRPVVAAVPQAAPSGLLDAAGPAAILVALAALAGFWVPWLSGLKVPLAVFGLLWGVAAFAVARGLNRSRFWPGVGAALAAVVLLIVLFPSSGPSARPSRPAPVLPVTAEVAWSDAREGAVTQGDVSVEVVSVAVGTLTVPPAAGKASAPPEQCLVVRLRTRRAGGADARAWKGKPQMTVTDERGKVYAPRTVRPTAAKAGEDVLVFEAPTTGRKFLHLEVPAAALGSPEPVRINVPGTLVRLDPDARFELIPTPRPTPKGKA